MLFLMDKNARSILLTDHSGVFSSRFNNPTALLNIVLVWSGWLFTMCQPSLVLAQNEGLAGADLEQRFLEPLPFADAIPLDSGFAKALVAAMSNHPSVRGQLALLQGAEYLENGSFAQRLPSVSLNGDNLGDRAQGTLVIQQPLWSFGKIDTQVALSRSQLRAEHISLLRVRRELLEETALAYAAIDGLRRQLQVATSNVEAHQSFYDRILRRQQGGVASESDVQFAWGRLVRAQSGLVNYEGQLTIAESRLTALTLVPVDTTEAVASEWLAGLTELELEQPIVEASADVLTSRQRLATAELNIKQSQYESLPTVSFRVERDLPNDPDTEGQIRSGFSLEANFTGIGYSSYSNIKSAMAQRVAAEQEILATEVELRREVQSLVTSLVMQKRLLRAQQAAAEAVGQTLASFVRQYETGRKSWIEVLNTQRELTEERIQLVDIENRVLEIRLQLASMAGFLDQLAGVAALPPEHPGPRYWRLERSGERKRAPMSPTLFDVGER